MVLLYFSLRMLLHILVKYSVFTHSKNFFDTIYETENHKQITNIFKEYLFFNNFSADRLVNGSIVYL